MLLTYCMSLHVNKNTIDSTLIIFADGEKYSEPEEPFGYYMNSHHLLDQLSPKEHYYKRKLELLEKKLSLYERGVEAQERIANALERYCSNINKSQ